MHAYLSPTHYLVQNGLWKAIPNFETPYSFFGHPPGLYIALAFLHRLFGEHIWISHLVVVLCSFAGVYFTYLLAKVICNRMTGVLAALFLFSSPIYFAQTGLFHGDIFITTLGIMSVYYAITHNYPAYLISGICLVMAKESAAAIIVALLLYLYFENRNQPPVRVKLLRYGVPLIILSVFFIIQKIITGTVLPNPYFNNHSFFNPSTKSLEWVFYRQGRGALTLLTLFALFFHWRSFMKREFALWMVIIGFFIVTYSFIYFLPRYILPALPYFFIYSAYAIVLLFNHVATQLLAAAPIITLFISQLYGTGTGYGSFETDMQYVDIVTTHKAACRYVEKTYPGKKILALWPLAKVMEEPSMGYVHKPLTIVTLNEVSDIILYTPQGTKKNEELKKIIQKRKYTLDKRYEKNGKFVEIYTAKVAAIPE